MVYQNVRAGCITIDYVYCESDDLSTAYKAVTRYKGNINTSYIKMVIEGLDELKYLGGCQVKDVKIVGDSIDRRAFLFLR